jgi:DNA-binding CsgD family transcriptional regulator
MFPYLLHQPYKNQDSINTVYNQIISNNDTAAALKKIRKISETGRQKRNRQIELEGELLEIYYNNYHKLKPVSADLKTIAEKGRREKLIYIEIAALLSLCRNNPMSDYEQNFNYFLRVNDIIRNLNEKEYAYKAECFYIIGEQYYFFRDYKTSISYQKKALKIKETSINWSAIWAANNTLGLCFQKMNKLDDSDYYFKKAIQSSYIKPDDIRYTIIQGNLGMNYFLRKDYKKALPLVMVDFNKAEEVEDPDLTANAAVLISKIYLKLGNKTAFAEWLEKAKWWHNRVKQKIPNSERLYTRTPELYLLMSKRYEIDGDEKMANHYLDSVIIAKDTLNAKLNTIYLLRATQSEHSRREDKMLFNEKLKNMQLLIVTIICVLMIIVAVLIYQILQRKRAFERLENEKKLSFAEERLREAQQHLDDFREDIFKRERLIEKLNHNAAENTEDIDQTLQNPILTKDDWEKFKRAFEIVHPFFFERMHKKVRNITPAEIRTLALVKMKLSRKEIASTLGISPDSIRSVWHRIRKKLDVDNQTTLEKFVERI